MVYFDHKLDLNQLGDPCTKCALPKVYNRFVDDISIDMRDILSDLNGISGTLPDEKTNSWDMFARARAINNFVASHKLNITTTGLWIVMLLFILRLLGVPISLLWPTISSMMNIMLGRLF